MHSSIRCAGRQNAYGRWKRKWRRPTLFPSGEIITSFALTEPDVGSDAGSVKARAVRDGNAYRLTGTKRYITNADKADLFTVMARTGDEPGSRGLLAFLVPRSASGVSVSSPEKKMGQRGAKSLTSTSMQTASLGCSEELDRVFSFSYLDPHQPGERLKGRLAERSFFARRLCSPRQSVWLRSSH